VLPQGVAIDTEIDLGKGEDGYALAARLAVSVPGVPREHAQAVVDMAHRTCPYSKAVRGNIDIAITLV
jgi:organic hydroperoxide reductase OsmC/OhrA